jgi:hypothetical protein
MNPNQLLLPLVQTVTTERAHSLVCIPDRTSAEDELRKLHAEYRARLLRATIRKDRPGKRSTYTLRYFTQHTDQVALF